MRTRTLPGLAAAVLVLTLAACGDGDTAEFDSATQSSSPDDADGTADGDDGDDGDDGTASPPADTAAGTGQPLATVTYPVVGEAGGSGATVTASVTALRVEGQVMVLELVFVPEFTASTTMTPYSFHGAGLQPTLNDRVNLKQYLLLRPEGGGVAWSAGDGVVSPSVASGEPYVWWGVYAAPQDPVDELVLSIAGGVPELTVPVQR